MAHHRRPRQGYVRIRRILGAAALWGGILILAACSSQSYAPPPTSPGQPKPYRVNGRWYQPIPHARGFEQEGVASWYGREFHGRKTSSGEIYDMYAISAAWRVRPACRYSSSASAWRPARA